MARTIFLSSLSLFVSTVLASTVKYNLNISNGLIAPDGVERNATLVNGGYPGPLIVTKKGDTLKVKVENNLTDPSMYRTTSIHWHGLLQHRNADNDGPAWCPIVPKESYNYTIHLGNQTGTYWYHGHVSAQYVDGLRGPLVIYPEDPHKQLYDVDDEKTVLIIGDWYHDSSKNILAAHNVTRQRPDSATINGKGRFNDTIPANPDTLYTLKVKQGKRYRMRVINSSAVASFRVGIQGHKLKVIAADGVSTKPYEVDEFEILAGQRIDCVVEANQNPDTYWINAPLTNFPNKTAQALLIYDDGTPSTSPPKGPYQTLSVPESNLETWGDKPGRCSRSGRGKYKTRAIGMAKRHRNIKRQNATATNENTTNVVTNGATSGITSGTTTNATTTNATTPVVMDESKLVPLENPGAACGSKPADLVLNLTFGLNTSTGNWMINGIPYRSPKIPTLLKILTDNDTVTQSDFTQQEHTIILPKDKCIEFNITGNSGLSLVHAIHLHGHTFDVVQFGNNTPNYVDPPRRDVVGSTDAGVRIQFKTNNPGPWFLHCHIDWHLEEGFAMVFAEAPEEIQKGPESVHVNEQWKNLCKKYDELPAGFE